MKNWWWYRVLQCSVILATTMGQQRLNQRQDAINDWIRTIRQSPKAHSISPSWSGQSPYKVIGVSDLPLQNEADPTQRQSRRRPQQQQQQERFLLQEDTSPFQQLVSSGNDQRDDHRRNGKPDGGGGLFGNGGRKQQPKENIQRNRPFNPQQQQQQQQQGKQQQGRGGRPNLGPPRRRNFSIQQGNENPKFVPPAASGEDVEKPETLFREQHQEMRAEENARKKLVKEEENEEVVLEEKPVEKPKRQQFPDVGPNPFLAEEKGFPRQTFEGPPRPGGPGQQQQQQQQQRPHKPLQRKYQGGPVRDLDVNAGFPPQFKPKLDDATFRKHKKPPREDLPSSENEVQHGFKPFFRPSQEDFPEEDDSAAFKLFEDDSAMNDGPIVELGDRPFPPPNRPSDNKRPTSTTPRPIPTPGPGDFPEPPPHVPQEETAPPTHPTHPPLITHPPEHFRPKVDSSFFSDADFKSKPKEEANSKDRPTFGKEERGDAAVEKQEEEEEDEGFFQIPSSFPSLETLGAGFESMKIRNKRAAADDMEERDLSTQERRFRPVVLRQPDQRGEGHRRQGDFGFQPGFWEEVETDLFSHEGPNFGQRNQPFTRRGQSHQQQEQYRNQRPTQQYYQQQNANPSAAGRVRDHYPQQSLQSYPPSANEEDEYSRNSAAVVSEKDNEILGSGNFEVIKGGTFYDDDTHQQTRHNSRPQNNYGGDFFENFRDFADIKGDLYQHYNY